MATCENSMRPGHITVKNFDLSLFTHKSDFKLSILTFILRILALISEVRVFSQNSDFIILDSH